MPRVATVAIAVVASAPRAARRMPFTADLLKTGHGVRQHGCTSSVIRSPMRCLSRAAGTRVSRMRTGAYECVNVHVKRCAATARLALQSFRGPTSPAAAEPSVGDVRVHCLGGTAGVMGGYAFVDSPVATVGGDAKRPFGPSHLSGGGDDLVLQ